jgi:hypothetical protein
MFELFGGRIRRRVRSALQQLISLQMKPFGGRRGFAYARSSQDPRQTGIIADPRVEDGDGGVEELHAGAEGGDAALEGGGGGV